MADNSQADESFSREVLRLRAENESRRVATNICPPGGPPVLAVDFERSDKSCLTRWLDDGTILGQCVRIFDVPGTLSGDILRLHRNLPTVTGHFEVDGDDIRPLDTCPEHPPDLEDDSEDVSDLISQLPLVSVNGPKHFLKKCKYRSEIENLTRCQGGSIPGRPLCPNVVQLLGRSSDGQLVFEKQSPWYVVGRFSSLVIYKRWILQLIDALEYLHAVGIVHRDLRMANLLFSSDGERLIVCDLESRWGERQAPEINFQGGIDDSGWTPRSDIYDIGNCIKGMVYANNPLTEFVEWPVPPPLQEIVEACMRPRPEDRPTLADLRILAEKI